MRVSGKPSAKACSTAGVEAAIRQGGSRSKLKQLQFHWGKPPPAADPSTRRVVMAWCRPVRVQEEARRSTGQKGACQLSWGLAGLRPSAGSAVGDVHRDFESEPDVGVCGCGPGHGAVSFKGGW